MVHKIIRHSEEVGEANTTSHQQQKQPVKPKASAKVKPKANIETSGVEKVKKNMKPLKKEGTPQAVKLVDQKKQKRHSHIVKDGTVNSEEAAMAEQSPPKELVERLPLREEATMNKGMIGDELMMGGDNPGAAAVVDLKQVVRRVPPESPRSKESFGNSLMKVSACLNCVCMCSVYLCVRVCVCVCVVCVYAFAVL